ncbi:MAG: hypothetical protein IJ494_08880 [Bacteroides sp.]|nr:hypothetical protein [Bacteroides sp.]
MLLTVSNSAFRGAVSPSLRAGQSVSDRLYQKEVFRTERFMGSWNNVRLLIDTVTGNLTGQPLPLSDIFPTTAPESRACAHWSNLMEFSAPPPSRPSALHTLCCLLLQVEKQCLKQYLYRRQYTSAEADFHQLLCSVSNEICHLCRNIEEQADTAAHHLDTSLLHLLYLHLATLLMDITLLWHPWISVDDDIPYWFDLLSSRYLYESWQSGQKQCYDLQLLVSRTERFFHSGPDASEASIGEGKRLYDSLTLFCRRTSSGLSSTPQLQQAVAALEGYLFLTYSHLPLPAGNLYMLFGNPIQMQKLLHELRTRHYSRDLLHTNSRSAGDWLLGCLEQPGFTFPAAEFEGHDTLPRRLRSYLQAQRNSYLHTFASTHMPALQRNADREAIPIGNAEQYLPDMSALHNEMSLLAEGAPEERALEPGELQKLEQSFKYFLEYNSVKPQTDKNKVFVNKNKQSIVYGFILDYCQRRHDDPELYAHFIYGTLKDAAEVSSLKGLAKSRHIPNYQAYRAKFYPPEALAR